MINDALLKETYANNNYFSEIYNTLTQPENISEKQRLKTKYFELNGQCLYLKEGQRLCIPKDKTLCTTILYEAHDNEISGHFGADKTYENVSKDFYWPKMNKEIQCYVSTCNTCQRNKATNQKPAGLLQTLETPSKCWEQVTMDFITHLPITKNGNNSIVVFID